MSENSNPGVGDMVLDFKLATFEPGFGEFSLAEAKKAKSWTILFFYPADFTFV
jgi:peroxiredoxin (alkyl hydroperoxide reductase subunit C)